MLSTLAPASARFPRAAHALVAALFPPTRQACSGTPKPTAALLFPGQGSQRVGMGKALAAASPVARRVFEEADAAVGGGLLRVMWEGAKADLEQTHWTQPAVLAHSVAVLSATRERVGEEEFDSRVACVMGHSLGQYTALVAAGALSLADAVQFVHARGMAMRSAVSGTQTGMVALLPLTLTMAEYLARQVVDGGHGVCEVANVNSPTQVVLSGTREAVNAAIELGKRDYGVMKAIELDVSAPFHSSLMRPAEDALGPLVAALPLRPARVPVVLNDTAAPESGVEAIRAGVRQHATTTVHWVRGVRRAEKEFGITEWVEFGERPVLTSLTKRCTRSPSEATLWFVGQPSDLPWAAASSASSSS